MDFFNEICLYCIFFLISVGFLDYCLYVCSYGKDINIWRDIHFFTFLETMNMDKIQELVETFELRAAFFLSEANKGGDDKLQLLGAHTAYVDAAAEVRKLSVLGREMEISVEGDDVVIRFNYLVKGIKLTTREAITYLRGIEKAIEVILDVDVND